MSEPDRALQQLRDMRARHVDALTLQVTQAGNALRDATRQSEELDEMLDEYNLDFHKRSSSTDSVSDLIGAQRFFAQVRQLAQLQHRQVDLLREQLAAAERRFVMARAEHRAVCKVLEKRARDHKKMLERRERRNLIRRHTPPLV